MKLTLERRYKKAEYTIGKLYVDGKYFCDTIEDKDRGLTQDMPLEQIQKIKVYGKTAIPTGTYEIRLTYSLKFGGRKWAKKYNGKIPQIIDVKGFSGIRIHPLNTAEDSLGCIGPGQNKAVGKVLDSTLWFTKLMDEYIVPAQSRNEPIYIDIH